MSKDKPEAVAVTKKAIASVINPDQIKKNLGVILQVFLKSETGNKVTAFNIAGLSSMIMGAVDGKVKFEEPVPPAQPKEKPPGE